MRRVRKRWALIAFWSVVWIVFLAALIFPEWMRAAIKRDRAGAKPQRGVATVAILVPATTDMTDQTSPAQVSVRFRGRIVPAKRVIGFERLTMNGPASILYRVGASGRIYIDTVEPVDSGGTK